MIAISKKALQGTKPKQNLFLVMLNSKSVTDINLFPTDSYHKPTYPADPPDHDYSPPC